MRNLRGLLVLLICVHTSAVFGQGPTGEGDLLERMTGTWVLRGTLAKKDTTHDVTGTAILDGQYVQLHEVSREKRPDGKPQYEAVVLIGFDPKTSEYQCLWLDTTGGGGLLPTAFGRCKRNGNTLPFLFREADRTVSFSNTFSYDKDTDSWRWQLDNIRINGTRSFFGDVRLSRQ